MRKIGTWVKLKSTDFKDNEDPIKIINSYIDVNGTKYNRDLTQNINDHTYNFTEEDIEYEVVWRRKAALDKHTEFKEAYDKCFEETPSDDDIDKHVENYLEEPGTVEEAVRKGNQPDPTEEEKNLSSLHDAVNALKKKATNDAMDNIKENASPTPPEKKPQGGG